MSLCARLGRCQDVSREALSYVQIQDDSLLALKSGDAALGVEKLAEEEAEQRPVEEKAKLALAVGAALLDDDRTTLSLAVKTLEKFLPGGVYADTPSAKQGRLRHAIALAAGGRGTEARSQFKRLIGDPDLTVTGNAAKNLHALCLIEGDERAALEAVDAYARALAATDAGDSEQGRIAAKELARLRQCHDENTTPTARAWARGFAYLDAAELARRFRDNGAVVEQFRKADEEWTPALGDLPSIDHSLTGEALVAEMDKRTLPAEAKLYLADYSGARALLEQVYDCRGRDLPDTQRSRPYQAFMLMIACDKGLGSPPEEIREKILEFLGSPQLPSISWAYVELSHAARNAGDAERAYLYLDEIVRLCDDAKRSGSATEERRKMDEEFPGLAGSVAGRTSDAFDALRSAGHLVQDDQGNWRLRKYRIEAHLIRTRQPSP